MDGVIAGNQLPPLDRLISAAEIGHESSRLAHQQYARCHIPRMQGAFPEAIIAAGCDVGEIERGRTEAANARADRPGRW